MQNNPDEQHQTPEDPDDAKEKDKSADEELEPDAEHKRGEGHGNLRKRSDWFQKRHGGG
jgi:hypothetical protein